MCPRCDRIEDLDLGDVMGQLSEISGPVLGVTVVALCDDCRRAPEADAPRIAHRSIVRSHAPA